MAFRLAGAGMKVAVVERHLVGGTCVNTGCTPTKALVASAYAARIARRAAEYGVVIGGDIGIDMRRVKARKDAIVAASRDGLTSALENAANITLYRSHARFASPQTVEVACERLHAGRIFINVGSRALVPPMPGINEVPYLTNSSMVDVDLLPQHLVIVGGSYIGLESGQLYRRFGSRVTIVEMAPQFVRHEDEDVSAAIKDIVEREGVDVRLNAECISLAKRGDEIVAKVDCAAGAPEVAGSHLLLAVGRKPNTDDLDLDTAGVRCDERGYIVVDDRLQTDGDSKEILGASLLGTGCDEAVHAILDLMYAKAPYTVMQRAMHTPGAEREDRDGRLRHQSGPGSSLGRLRRERLRGGAPDLPRGCGARVPAVGRAHPRPAQHSGVSLCSAERKAFQSAADTRRCGPLDN